MGRRFRALKLWSVIRTYGVEGLREKIREHIRIAKHLADLILADRDFEILAPVTLSVVCFRYKPTGYTESQINRINENLNHALNDSGKIYLTHTVLNGKYTLRMVTSQTNVSLEHVEKAWTLIASTARTTTI
jgi:aromatic-L-amino-acid decarboxylase